MPPEATFIIIAAVVIAIAVAAGVATHYVAISDKIEACIIYFCKCFKVLWGYFSTTSLRSMRLRFVD